MVNMPSMTLVLFAASAIVALFIVIGFWFWNRETVWAVEKTLFMDRPFLMVGQPDLIAKRRNHLIIYDKKTRNSGDVKLSDRIQMTAYKWLAEQKWGIKVKRLYIVTNKQQVRIKPLSRKEMLRLYERWCYLQGNPNDSVKTGNLHNCKSCQFYKKRCTGADTVIRK